jgi:exodeoxyribonuclease V
MTIQAAIAGQPAAPVLNKGQEAAVDAFNEFLFSDSRELDIRGPGGVGKTFVMSWMIDKVMPRYFQTCKVMGIPPQYDTVEMTAVTNKAAEVLAQATQRPTSTIHSYLCLKVSNDRKTGETGLARRNDWEKKERVIVFIDEASMIDSALYFEIHAALGESCKIVYVGDHCQLAPVKERISPIYRNPIKHVELTENVRAAGQPALLALTEQLRETVKTNDFQPIQCVPGVIEHMDDVEMEQEIAKLFRQQTRDHRVLCYTNDRVRMFNNHIRDLRAYTDTYEVGEWLVNNNAFKFKDMMVSVEAEVKIVRVGSDTEMVPIDGDRELEVRKADLQLGSGGILQDVSLPENVESVQQLMAECARAKRWDAYFTLKECYPDLRPRDAGTVYKAQGSTYDTVVVDVGDISTCHNPQQVARMLYVAASRPRTRLILFGELNEQYGGIIK